MKVSPIQLNVNSATKDDNCEQSSNDECVKDKEYLPDSSSNSSCDDPYGLKYLATANLKFSKKMNFKDPKESTD